MNLTQAHHFKHSARLAMQSAAIAAHHAKGERKVEADAKLAKLRTAYQKASEKYDQVRNKENGQ